MLIFNQINVRGKFINMSIDTYYQIAELKQYFAILTTSSLNNYKNYFLLGEVLGEVHDGRFRHVPPQVGGTWGGYMTEQFAKSRNTCIALFIFLHQVGLNNKDAQIFDICLMKLSYFFLLCVKVTIILFVSLYRLSFVLLLLFRIWLF